VIFVGIPTVHSSNRRGALKALTIASLSAFWAACKAQVNGAPGIPTLANIEQIRTAQSAQPPTSTQGVQPEPTLASTPESVNAPEATHEPETSAETQAAPSGPSVKRGPDGILITWPQERFYETRYRTASPRPEINAADWKLTISGWVKYPQALSLEDILDLPQVDRMQTLECISNPSGGSLISNATWRGVKLADVLDLADMKDAAHEILMTAADGYFTSIPVDLALNPESLLVYEMNGGPLPVKNGYPLRVLLPGHYGQKQPKWITGIEVVTKEVLGYWEQRGWSNEAKVRVNSQIWGPRQITDITGDSATISGIAFADDSGVSQVEVSTDKGITWNLAELIHGPSSLVWTEWQYEWTLPHITQPTTVNVAVRATDGHGSTQRSAPEGAGPLNNTFPDGTSDIHHIAVVLKPSS